jgi:hypothetical protein
MSAEANKKIVLDAFNAIIAADIPATSWIERNTRRQQLVDA